MATTERTGIADFYERDVLPALVQRRDQAFPEFAWQRDLRGWHATNQEFTHTTLGVRADRVICHGVARLTRALGTCITGHRLVAPGLPSSANKANLIGSVRRWPLTATSP